MLSSVISIDGDEEDFRFLITRRLLDSVFLAFSFHSPISLSGRCVIGQSFLPA